MEISNNIGELFQDQVKSTKQGAKIEKMKNGIAEAKLILDSLDMNDTVEVAKEKSMQMLRVLYKGHNLTKQIGYLSQKRTTLDVITQAYNNILMKQNSLEKAETTLEEDMAGI